jgi:hypothetical protein
LWLLSAASVISQESSETGESMIPEGEILSRKSETAVSTKSDSQYTAGVYVIKVNLKIIDDEENELVNSKWKIATVSGKAVVIHVKGNNLIIKADLTPYYVDNNSLLLLTRGNVMLMPTDSEASKYYSTVNSLPVKLGEKALFFPLGLLNEKMENISSCVLEIEVQPYDNTDSITASGSEQVGQEFKKE